jgi:predicted aminopeptidase
MWVVKTWWGDGWSYGTRYYSEREARRAADGLRAEGWTVDVERV